MTTCTLDPSGKGLTSYTDKQRYLWSPPVYMPIIPMPGIIASIAGGQTSTAVAV